MSGAENKIHTNYPQAPRPLILALHQFFVNSKDIHREEVEEKIKNIMTNEIMYCQWGYSMTIVDFYRVIKETAKTLLLKKIKQEKKANGFLTGTTTPVNEFADGNEAEQVRLYKKTAFADIGKNKPYFTSKTRGYTKSFHFWDNKPVAYNHCD